MNFIQVLPIFHIYKSKERLIHINQFSNFAPSVNNCDPDVILTWKPLINTLRQMCYAFIVCVYFCLIRGYLLSN